MRLISTRGPAIDPEGGRADGDGGRIDEASGAGRDRLRAAVLGGLAPDGGLFLPAELPRLTPGELAGLRHADFQETAELVGLRLLGPTLGPEVVRDCVRGALDFDVPVVPLEGPDDSFVLELFHGPTGSFKDVGARFLARLLSHLRGGEEERVIVLVATSGDTGGAVARAVHGLPGVHAVICYPEGRMSPIQLQHVMPVRPEDEASVHPVPVRGSFDDCQRMVKAILAEGSPVEGTAVTSANSVNLGRLIPQVFFHVHAWARCPKQDDLIVSVPSANLGNLTAALVARRMGVPLGRLVAATNRNAALPRYLESGVLPAGASLETLSNAMDVAQPSNLERLLALADGSREALGMEITATSHSDEETLRAMRTLHEARGYLADPHTAVGWLGLEEARRARPHAPGLVVATADPAKFPETVLRATGRLPEPRAEWEAEGGGAGAAPPPMPPETGALRELIRGL